MGFASIFDELCEAAPLEGEAAGGGEGASRGGAGREACGGEDGRPPRMDCISAAGGNDPTGRQGSPGMYVIPSIRARRSAGVGLRMSTTSLWGP